MALFWVALLACLMAACDGGDGERSGEAAIAQLEPLPPLPEPETFVWDDQPISFSPPPAGWERQREQSGGLMGARFVKLRSVGERIHIAEHTSVGRRDRCSELEAILSDLDELDQRQFTIRLQRARPYLSDPINDSEVDYFDAANERLDDARTAFREEDMIGVRREIGGAIDDLAWVEFELEEVVDRVIFEPEDLDSLGRVEILGTRAGEVDDEPSLTLDYLFHSFDRDRTYHGREVYVEYNNRLFVASFMGLEENLRLFDAIVDTITFPEGECDH